MKSQIQNLKKIGGRYQYPARPLAHPKAVIHKLKSVFPGGGGTRPDWVGVLKTGKKIPIPYDVAVAFKNKQRGVFFKEYAVMVYRSKEWVAAQSAAHRSGIIWVWSPKGNTLAWATNGSKTCKVNGKIYKPVTMSFTGIEDHGKMLDVIYDNDPNLYKKFSPYTDCIYGRITNTGKITVYDEKPAKERKKDKAIDAIYKYIKESLTEFSVAQYRSKDWQHGVGEAHKKGSIMFVWTPRGGQLAWGRVDAKECYVNNKAYKWTLTGRMSMSTHGDVMDGIFAADPSKSKLFRPVADCVKGRITKAGLIVLYDESPARQRKQDKAIDAVYKYIKESSVLEKLSYWGNCKNSFDNSGDSLISIFSDVSDFGVVDEESKEITRKEFEKKATLPSLLKNRKDLIFLYHRRRKIYMAYTDKDDTHHFFTKESSVLEAASGSCEDLFGKVLFGEFKQFYKKDQRETNTDYEQRVWMKVWGWIRGEYIGTKKDAVLSRAFDSLMKCKKVYPRVLKGKKRTLYRGFREWSSSGAKAAGGEFINKVLSQVKKIKPESFKPKTISGTIFYSAPFTYKPESKFQSWSTSLQERYAGAFVIKADVPDSETLFSSYFLNALSRSFGFGSEGEVIRVGGSIKGTIMVLQNTFWELFPETEPSFKAPWKRDQKLLWPEAPELRGKRAVAFSGLSNDWPPFDAIVLMPGRKPKKGGRRYKDKYINIPVMDLLKHNPVKGIDPATWDKSKWHSEGLTESKLERLTDQYNTTPAVARYYFGTAKLPKKIKVWRACESGNIKRGDFVTADKEMAELHMRTDKYKLVTKVVPSEHLRIVGSSGKKGNTEFVYEP